MCVTSIFLTMMQCTFLVRTSFIHPKPEDGPVGANVLSLATSVCFAIVQLFTYIAKLYPNPSSYTIGVSIDAMREKPGRWGACT